MAKLDVSIAVPLDPETTWKNASNLEDYEKWLTIHDGWRSPIPDELTEGLEISSIVAVKGMRNRVKWTLLKYEPPKKLQLKGDGKGGVKIKLLVTVTPKGDESELKLDVDMGGAPLFGPIGSGVARALKGDIEKSLQKFVELYS
ncbi:SRPBCC family protein [Actinomycetes bacterium M1A6_2h]